MLIYLLLLYHLQTPLQGQANPQFILTGTNAIGSVATEIYRNKPTAGSLGDVLHLQAVYGKDSANTKQEYTRITHSIRDATAGGEDGSIDFACVRAGAINTFLQINGFDNEINLKKNLDVESNSIVTTTTNITLDATGSAGTGDIFLTPKVATGFIKASKDIQTDSKITTLTDPTGCSLDFAGGTPDYRFTLDTTKIELHYNNLTTSSFQTIFQDITTEEAYFKQTYNDIVGVNTIETIIENDATHHRIKLSETASGANTEITKDEINIDGSGLTMKLTTSSLQFNDAGVLTPLTISSTLTPILLTSTGDITLTPTTSVVLNTQIQMPTTSGTISYSNISGFLSIDFASQSTGYFELSNLPPASISGLTLTNGRVGGEYHILLRGQSGFNYSPATSATYKANTYSLSTTNGSEWIGLKIYFTNTLTQYLVN